MATPAYLKKNPELVRKLGELGLFNEACPHAEWKVPPPDDPNALRRFRGFRWERVLTILIVVTPIAFELWWHSALRPFVPWLSLATVVSSLLIRELWFRNSVPALAHLMDVPSVIPQFPVEVVFRRNATGYGSDSGIVSFVDGVLSYQGLRTSFSMTPEHCCPMSETRSGRILEPKFVYVVGGSICQVSFFPLDVVRGVGSGYSKRFRKLFTEWRYSRDGEGAAVLLPPRQPEIERRLKLWTGFANALKGRR